MNSVPKVNRDLILQTVWNALSSDPKYILLNPHDSISFENNFNRVALKYLQMWVFVVLYIGAC